MGPKCAVPNCKGSKLKKLFSLPTGLKNTQKRQQWLTNLGVEEPNLPKVVRVCLEHFCRNDVEVGFLYGKNKDIRLLPQAVPHLRMGTSRYPCCSPGSQDFEQESSSSTTSSSPDNRTSCSNSLPDKNSSTFEIAHTTSPKTSRCNDSSTPHASFVHPEDCSGNENENSAESDVCENHTKKIEALQREVSRLKRQNAKLKAKLETVFNSNRISGIERGTRASLGRKKLYRKHPNDDSNIIM